jgi:hypothetical protein
MTPRDSAATLIQLLRDNADDSGNTMEGALDPQRVRAIGTALEALAEKDTGAQQLLREATRELDGLRFTDQRVKFNRPPWEK